MRARPWRRRRARLLCVPLLSPILTFTGVTLDRDRQAVDVAEIACRGDRFRFAVSFDVSAAMHRRGIASGS